MALDVYVTILTSVLCIFLPFSCKAPIYHTGNVLAESNYLFIPFHHHLTLALSYRLPEPLSNLSPALSPPITPSSHGKHQQTYLDSYLLIRFQTVRLKGRILH